MSIGWVFFVSFYGRVCIYLCVDACVCMSYFGSDQDDVVCFFVHVSRPRVLAPSRYPINRVVVATPDASARRDDDDDDAHDADDDDADDDDDARDGNARRTTRDGALGARPIGPGTTLPDDDDDDARERERERGDPARAPVPRRTRVRSS